MKTKLMLIITCLIAGVVIGQVGLPPNPSRPLPELSSETRERIVKFYRTQADIIEVFADGFWKRPEPERREFMGTAEGYRQAALLLERWEHFNNPNIPNQP